MTEFSAALTPAEWADLPEHVDAGLYSAPAAWHRTMAVANARLPEGHRGKITRQDVDDCIAAAQIVESGDGGAPDYEQGARYRALADALASILPPENTRRFVAGEDLPPDALVYRAPDGKIYRVRPPLPPEDP